MNFPCNQDQIITELSEKLVRLVGIFRKGGPANDFNWWNSANIFLPLYGYQEGKPLFDEVVQGVIRLNPEMLSEYEVKHRLKFDFLEHQTVSVNAENHLQGESLLKEAKDLLVRLISFKAWQNVDVAIANLTSVGEPFTLGEVTFVSITEEEIEQWKKRGPVSERISDVRVVARVKSPGDRQRALTYALDRVKQAIDILRAFCFPFGRESETWLVGLLGEIIDSKHTPVRIDDKDFVTLIGTGIAQIELRKHVLSRLLQEEWELINNLILKKGHSDTEIKLLESIHWLAESTKPDTRNAKFAKIGFALEALIGGEAEDEELKVRGITAMLAERAAFIGGTSLEDRLKIDKDVRKYYGKRSKIVHGGNEQVSLDDIDGFGLLTRRLTLALLRKIFELGVEIGDVEKLEKWIKTQKYRCAA
jgi:hypothetical protein